MPSTNRCSKRLVIWLRVVSPRMAPGRNTSWRSAGCSIRALREQLLDLPLVVRVRELGVAAQRVVLRERYRVVGVVAVRRAAAGDDELADARVDARRQHVRGAQDVDRVLELAGASLPRRDDGCEVHDTVDRCAPAARRRARDRGRRRRGRRHRRPGPRAVRRARRRPRHARRPPPTNAATSCRPMYPPAPVTSTDRSVFGSVVMVVVHPAGSACISLNVIRLGANLCAIGSTSTWTTAQRPAARHRSSAGRSSPGSRPARRARPCSAPGGPSGSRPDRC